MSLHNQIQMSRVTPVTEENYLQFQHQLNKLFVFSTEVKVEGGRLVAVENKKGR